MTVTKFESDQQTVDHEDNPDMTSASNEESDPKAANGEQDASPGLEFIAEQTADDTESSHSNDSQLTLTQENCSENDTSNEPLTFPRNVLNAVEAIINKQNWLSYNVLCKKVQTLLDISMDMIRNDLDEKDDLCQHFLSDTLRNFFITFYSNDTMEMITLEDFKLLVGICFKIIDLIVLSFCRDNVKLLELLSLVLCPNTRFACTTIEQPFMNQLNSYAADNESGNGPQKILILDLINYFGNNSGFDTILFRLRSGELSLNKILAYLKPLNTCLHFLTFKSLELYIVPILETVPLIIQNLSDEELKKEVKNEGKSDVISNIIKILRNFSLKLPLENEFTKCLDFLKLKILSRLLEISSFNGKMNALNEINKLIMCYSNEHPNRFQYDDSNDLILTSDQLAQWFIENKVLEIVLKDYLHQFQYVEKLENIIRFLIRENALSNECLNMIWDAQRGKHEIIVKNIHDLIAKLAWNFSSDQLNYLFHSFQSSWTSANKKEREKLLELMGRLAEDDEAGSMANQVLNLLWDIAFTDDDIDIIDQALCAHLRILDYSRNCDKESQKLFWLEKCIMEVSTSKCGNLVLLALRQIQQICLLYQLSTRNRHNENSNKFGLNKNRCNYTFRNSLIANLQSKFSLVAVISHNLSSYMEMIKQVCKNSPTPIDPNVIYEGNRFSHVQEVKERLHFIAFVLKDGFLWLCLKQADDIWNCLAQNAVFDVDRQICFRWFTCLMENESDLDPEIFLEFFEMNILKLEPALVDINGIECFENFFNAVNCKEGKLLLHQNVYLMEDNDLIGLNYLWDLILCCNDEAATKAIEILKNLYTNLGPKFINSQVNLHHDLISICADRLKANYDTISIIKNDPIEGKKMKIEQNKATRVLTFLYEYINKCDYDFSHERTILPMIYSFRGKPIMITIKIINMNCDSLELNTHTNESLFSIRNRILSTQNLTGNVDIEFFTEFSSCQEKIDLSINKYICQITTSNHLNLSARIMYSGSNISCDGDREKNIYKLINRKSFQAQENNLPGVILSKNSNLINFLFDLADVGTSMKYFPLREKCLSILKLIPPDASSIQFIKTLCTNVNVNEANLKQFEAELFVTTTKSVYLLGLIYSMLLPSNFVPNESQEFQTIFIENKCGFYILRSLNNMLNNSAHTDNFCKICAILITLKITKFVLSSIAYLKAFLLNSNINMNDSLQTIPSDPVIRRVAMSTAQIIYYKIQVKDEPTLPKELDFVPEKSTIDSIIMVVWSSATGSYDYLAASPEALHGYFMSDTYQMETNDNSNPFDCYEVCVEAIEVLVMMLMFSPNQLNQLIVTEKWQNFFLDLLLVCNQTVIREAINQQFTLFFTKTTHDIQLLLRFVTLMFDGLQKHVPKYFLKSSEFFELFCNLLNHLSSFNCRDEILTNLLRYEINLLKNAREYFLIDGQFEVLQLEGHLKIMKHLVLLLDSTTKFNIGSNENQFLDCETGFVNILLDDYLFTASKCLCLLQRDSLEPDISSIDPICFTSKTMVAAYELLVALCTGCVENLQYVCRVLENYLNNFSIPNWEYMPYIGTRASQFVGLKNAGATCYMNSVLQQFFMITEVREALLSAKVDSMYHFDDNPDEDPKNYNINILKQIQIIFGHLLLSKCQYYIPKGFWNQFKMSGRSINLQEQQDAVEFFNNLFDALDEALKSLGYGGLMSNIFGGLFADQKICKGCPHRYSREESFTILIVDIRNQTSLINSLEQYVKGDLLEGDNAYHCEKCNRKVDTVKRLCIKKLPKILTIQLKRFDYDFEQECAVKFNDYFEFPRTFDMNPYTVNGLAEIEGEVIDAPELDQNLSTEYELAGIVVHSGQATGGHYYSFILHQSTDGQRKWFRFEDQDVSECKLEDDDELKNQCFGGEYVTDVFDKFCNKPVSRPQKRMWNAFILIYRRIDKQLAKSPTQNESTLAVPFAIRNNVQRQNILFMHQKYQFSQEFYLFIKLLLKSNIRSLTDSSLGATDVEKIVFATLNLAAKFMFTFCFKTSKTLRGSAVDWYELLIPYLNTNSSVRIWFIENHLCFPRTISDFLLECPSADVRLAFSKLILFLCHYCLIENQPLVSDTYIISSKSYASRTVNLLIKLIYKEVPDNSLHSAQYFNLFYLLTTLGPEERQLLLLFDVPAIFMQVSSDEGHNQFRHHYSEFPKLYQVVSLLIRCCDISSEAKQCFADKPPLPNPFKHENTETYILPIQPHPREMLFCKVDYLKKIVKDAISVEDNIKLIKFCGWENIKFSMNSLREIFWYISYSLNFELKPYFTMLSQILVMEDSWQDFRIRVSLVGDENHGIHGIFNMLQTHPPHIEKRTYQCIQFLVGLFSSCSKALDILKDSPVLKSKWVDAVSWLRDELDNKYSSLTSTQYNNWSQVNNINETTNQAANAVLKQAETILTEEDFMDYNDSPIEGDVPNPTPESGENQFDDSLSQNISNIAISSELVQNVPNNKTDL